MFPYERREFEILVREEKTTDPNYGCEPSKRPIKEQIRYGVVNIDKPAGPTSHQVAGYTKEILGLSKAGHSGTLDPKVTGVLPVALQNATRITHLLLKAGKEYVGIMHIHNEFDTEQLKKTIKKFTGKISQLPPVKSSVKRRLRDKHVYNFEILEIKNRDVLFQVKCEAGTYIRKLVHDIGQKMKTGAHMAQLRRTRVGPFMEESSVYLQDLRDAYHYYNKGNPKFLNKCIVPIEKAVEHIPKVWVLDSAVDNLCHGANLKKPGVSKVESDITKQDMVAVLTLKGELVCYGRATVPANEMIEGKGMAVVLEKVFMQRGTYPKFS